MAHGKQKKAQKDGQYRKETKEERRLRLERQQQARERCFRALPYVGALIVAFLLAFAWYVRSVPPTPPRAASVTPERRASTGSAIPEFMYVDTSKNEPEEEEQAGESEQGDEEVLVDLDRENQPKEQPNDNTPPDEPETVVVSESKSEEEAQPPPQQQQEEEYQQQQQQQPEQQETQPGTTKQEEPPPQQEQQQEMREEPMTEL